MGETALRTLLGSFLFSGSEVFKQVKVLSGGERARLALLRMLLSGANLLLLDEPTNHLDMESRAALGEALESYKGALILVTHDRDLMQTVCSRFLVVANGSVTPLEGELDDYLERVTQTRNASPPGATTPRKEAREVKRQAGRLREQELRQKKQQARQLESRIQQLESEHATLSRELADPEIYQASNQEKLLDRVARDKKISAELAKILLEWETLAMEIEEAAAP
jgi:ATP-binding cassette subfamily F protein 3